MDGSVGLLTTENKSLYTSYGVSNNVRQEAEIALSSNPILTGGNSQGVLPIRPAPIDPRTIPNKSESLGEVGETGALFTAGTIFDQGAKGVLGKGLGGGATAVAFGLYSVGRNWQGLTAESSHLQTAAGLRTVIDISAGIVAFEAGLIAGKVGAGACSFATPVGSLLCGGGASVVVGSGTYLGLNLVKYTSIGDYIRKEEAQGEVEEKLQQLGIKLIVKKDSPETREQFFGQVRLEVKKGLRITEGQLFNYYLDRLLADPKVRAGLDGRQIKVVLKDWDDLTPARFEPVISAVVTYLRETNSPKKQITVKASVDAHMSQIVRPSRVLRVAVDQEGYFLNVEDKSYFGVTNVTWRPVPTWGSSYYGIYKAHRDYGRL